MKGQNSSKKLSKFGGIAVGALFVASFLALLFFVNKANDQRRAEIESQKLSVAEQTEGTSGNTLGDVMGLNGSEDGNSAQAQDGQASTNSSDDSTNSSDGNSTQSTDTDRQTTGTDGQSSIQDQSPSDQDNSSEQIASAGATNKDDSNNQDGDGIVSTIPRTGFGQFAALSAVILLAFSIAKFRITHKQIAEQINK